MNRTHKLGSVGVAGVAPQHTHHHSHQQHPVHHHTIHHRRRLTLKRPKQPKKLAIFSAVFLAICVFAGIVNARSQDRATLIATQIPISGRLSATPANSTQASTPTRAATTRPRVRTPVVSAAIQHAPQIPVNTATQPYVGSLPDNIPVYTYETFNFYYAGGREFATATGASVSLSQTQPTVPSQPDAENHSLIELAVMSPDGKQVVEVGWVVDKVMNGDDLPHLFVYHWVDDQTTCYNACGFVQTSTSIFPGQAVAVGSAGSYGIQFTNNAWGISYNGVEVGYFPASLWGNNFTSFGFVEAFGEVALSSSATTSCIQMGNGLAGSNSGSAKISNFKLTGSNVPEALSPYATMPSTYSYGSPSATSVSLGGPGTC